MRIHRRHLTLLEMLFVIAIMGLVLGLIGINIKKAVHEQRFRNETAQVVDALRIAQYIMLILDNDAHVKLTQGENGIRLQIETACPLASSWNKLILAPKVLQTIRVVNFKDIQQTAAPSPGTADIRFLSAGYVMSQGIMRLATVESVGEKGALESYICLPGYPSTIKSAASKPGEKECYSLMEEGFVEGLTHTMVGEIKNLEAAKKDKNSEEQWSGQEPLKEEGNGKKK